MCERFPAPQEALCAPSLLLGSYGIHKLPRSSSGDPVRPLPLPRSFGVAYINARIADRL